jgi:hypothetical protein
MTNARQKKTWSVPDFYDFSKENVVCPRFFGAAVLEEWLWIRIYGMFRCATGVRVMAGSAA